MSAPAAPVSAERYDFRSVMASGTKLGLAVGFAVVLFLTVSRFLPEGVVQQLAQTIVVLAAGTAAAFLPGLWVAPRSGEGIAGAAAVGLWGTVVFSAFDIVVLRPLHAYPWTWDAIGGNSTWWYLPLWWMLGTFIAWMGGIVVARVAPVVPGLARLALPTAVGGIAIGIGFAFAGLSLAIATGAGFVLSLAVRALVALARAR
ncbi:MAG TPA: hypothetical protein VF978_06630 [Gemmatimonadales bacterium]